MKKKFNNWIANTVAQKSDQHIFVKKMIIYSIVVMSMVSFTSCKKDAINQPPALPTVTSNAINSNGEFLTFYSGLSKQTSWELQQARAATARYRNIKNAIKDGYADINVVVQNMGYHYMKSDYVDATFDPRKPEILVYNKNADGSWQLLAVEYAIPLNLSLNAPEGFTGDGDVWDHNTTFGLWLCHAWVWSYNPDGVFHDTNPLIDVH